MEWLSPQVTLVPAGACSPQGTPHLKLTGISPVLLEGRPWPLLGTMSEVGKVINLPQPPRFIRKKFFFFFFFAKRKEKQMI